MILQILVIYYAYNMGRSVMWSFQFFQTTQMNDPLTMICDNLRQKKKKQICWNLNLWSNELLCFFTLTKLWHSKQRIVEKLVFVDQYFGIIQH